MKRAAVPSILVAVVLLAVGVIAEAQQPGKIPRIGYLSAGSLPSNVGPYRGIQAGSARAWLRGGEKYHH